VTAGVGAEAPDPAQDALAGIHAELAGLHAQNRHLNQIMDRLHAENERLRSDETEQLLQPLFRDLIKLGDDWASTAAVWSTERDAATPQDVARRCGEMAEDAAMILQRYGVERFSPDPGVAFERRLHRAVASTATGDPGLDGTVAQVRRAGYAYGEKVIRFAEVLVHQHVPAPPDPLTAPPADPGTT
jgi:molecular chaperone GrpE (heat shock protein)